MRHIIMILCFGLLFNTLYAQQRIIKFKLEEVLAPADYSKSCISILLRIRDMDSKAALSNMQVLLSDQDESYPYISNAKGEVFIVTGEDSPNIIIKPSGKPYDLSAISELKMEKGKHYLLLVDMPKRNIIEIDTEPRPLKKPVIYLYPEQATELTLSLKINGELTFSYPKYENGWTCTAMPNGDIKIGQKTYPYLFWEGLSAEIDSKIQQTGFVVASENIVSFLEEKLAHIGLNDKEMTDFITFWAPRLEQNAYSYLHFATGEAYSKNVASLVINITPTTEIRLFMYHSPVGPDFKVESQELPTFERKGFTLVEWGGGPIELTNN